MSLVKWGFIGLLTLPAAEFVVFVLVAMAIGFWRALALFLATSLIGVLVLKRAGRTERDRFRAALASRGAAAIELESPSLAAMIGGILLVFQALLPTSREHCCCCPGSGDGSAWRSLAALPRLKPTPAPREQRPASRWSIWSRTNGTRFPISPSTTNVPRNGRHEPRLTACADRHPCSMGVPVLATPPKTILSFSSGGSVNDVD
jgi:hypothetical protein